VKAPGHSVSLLSVAFKAYFVVTFHSATMPQKVYVTYNQVCRDLYLVCIRSTITLRDPCHTWSQGLSGDFQDLRS
jgi:hypothetical protein